MSPDGKEFCPDSWFEVDKEMHQDGFCKQASWKCCFVCVCLPVCYPCYLSRTIRWVVVDVFTIVVELFEYYNLLPTSKYKIFYIDSYFKEKKLGQEET